MVSPPSVLCSGGIEMCSLVIHSAGEDEFAALRMMFGFDG
ncbi:hypothetical protein BJ969_002937 [Saccharopolyspora gloriosae]|uniref:Uncharacterized protein n=1 Tax=Saccharopolyspora gloriosae TaxID=455344 RepID=A0A840NKN8_9PSEU|nr:hypothetical protein [Saccharopolyspora gloriosae]